MEVIKINGILNGGLGSELERMGHCFDGDKLWSARTLFSDPDSVSRVYEIFSKHGSTIGTTMTYQASVDGFMNELGVDSSEAHSLIASSVQLVKDGCSSLKVAGSIGPYGACKCDMSEYTGDYPDKPSIEALMDWHRPRMKTLVEAGCDILAIETIPKYDEAKALLNLLKEFPNMKAWLAFSCQTADSISSGEKFSEVVSRCIEADVDKQLVAIGINCCDPGLVHSLIKISSNILPPYCSHIVYPNGSPRGESRKECPNFLGVPFVKLIEDYNVRWVGGCCYAAPKDIESLVDILKQSKNISV